HFDATALPEEWRRNDIFAHLLGHHVGHIAGRRVPVISGLVKSESKDSLKALSAAAASSGGVELWHGAGVTPEAPELASVFGKGETRTVTSDDLRAAHRELSTASDGPLDAVALGTPHFSFTEFAELIKLLDGRKMKSGLTVYVSTSRGVHQAIAATGGLEVLE